MVTRTLLAGSMDRAPRHDATRRIGVVATVALLGLFAGSAHAAEPLRLLICQPGGPQLAEEQQSSIETMYRYIERKTGLSEGRIQGRYTNDREECVDALGQTAIVIPSLPIFLEHKDKYGLVPVAQLKVNGKIEDHFYVLVDGESSIKSISDLKGKKITGTHLGSNRFVLDIVLEGKLAKGDLVLKPKRFGLRAIRAVTKGKADAVLLDGTQYRALAGTRFEKDLRVLHTSKALPTPPITVVAKAIPAGFGAKLGRALVGMTNDPEGQRVVQLFGIEGFELTAPKTWASLEKRIKSAP